MVRPFRFGLRFTEELDGPHWADLARRLEGEGFSTLLVADHYVNPMSCGCGAIPLALSQTTDSPKREAK